MDTQINRRRLMELGTAATMGGWMKSSRTSAARGEEIPSDGTVAAAGRGGYVHTGHTMGDAWYFVDDSAGQVHMYYLTQPLDERGPRFVGHAVSDDLRDWETLPPAIEQGPPGAWDDEKVCSGSVFERDGRYWMAYSATSSAESPPSEPWRWQRIGVAWSDDLTHWTKLGENPVMEAGPPHYERMGSGQRKMHHWRDPFLFEHGGHAYAFITARATEGRIKQRGVVALARSSDMHRWEILPPIEHDRIAEEMEVPQIYQINERWYLVFLTLGRFMAPGFAERFEGAVPERSNFAMVGDSPFGPFRIHGTGQIIPHGLDEYFYAAQLVHWRQKWWLLATIHDDRSQRICRPIEVYVDATGIHPVA
jgi:beta-fructofuranosidase